MSRLKTLLKVFFYDVEGDRAEEWKLVPSVDTFGEVVYHGEMQPNEWPKYRYILLELWHSTDQFIEEIRKSERDECRTQVLKSLHNRRCSDLCRELGKNEQDLTDADWTGIFDRSYKAFDGLLRNLGLKAADERMTEAQARDVVKRPLLVPADVEDGFVDTQPSQADIG